MNSVLSDNKRLWQFDYLKTICIIMVIVTHCGFSNNHRSSAIYLLFINMAVPIFMIISGYMSANSMEKKTQSFLSYFTPKNLYNKLSKIIFPFLIVYLIELSWHTLKAGKIPDDAIVALYS